MGELLEAQDGRILEGEARGPNGPNQRILRRNTLGDLDFFLRAVIRHCTLWVRGRFGQVSFIIGNTSSIQVLNSF